MLKSRICDYGNAYIFVKGAITAFGVGAMAARKASNRQNNISNKQAIFKNFPPFTDCINKINETQVFNAKDPDAVMQNYNLMEFSDNSSKAPAALYRFCRKEPYATKADFTSGCNFIN